MEIDKDIQNIINYSFKFAEKMLLSSNEYYPFGVQIDTSGELTTIGFKDRETEFPEVQKVIDQLKIELEREFNNGGIRAYGLTSNVQVQTNNLPSKLDTIMIDIYHLDSNEIPKYYFPYTRDKNNELIFGESFGIKK